jgi:hypothetical protein
MRALAWLCVLVVLFSVAVPLAGAPPAIHEPTFVLVGVSVAVVIVRAIAETALRDRLIAADVPARAPPLA